GYSKNQLEDTNRELNELSNSFTNNRPTFEFTDVLGDYYVLDEVNTKLEVTKATKLLDKNNANSFETIQKKATNTILKHLDINKTYKLKSGLFKIEDSLSFKTSENKKDTLNRNLLISRKFKTLEL